jgi:hypothetical protein
MGKRDTVLKNLRILTGRRTLKSAATGWQVKELVNLSRPAKWQACELCGTRFQIGAWITHPKTKGRILVGGTCLDTILSQAFSSPREIMTGRRNFKAEMHSRYRDVVDPGSWLKWLRNNAPSRFASALAYVLRLGTPRVHADLDELIRFHDRRRRFSRESLFPDWRALSVVMPIPEFITLRQYDMILKKFSKLRSSAISGRALHRYRETTIRLWLSQGKERTKEAWARLAPNGKRTVVALAILTESKEPEGLVCPDTLAQLWPAVRLPLRTDAFIWNNRVGMGVCDVDQDELKYKSDVWLWDTGRWSPLLFDLMYWRTVNPPSIIALQKLETLALQALAPRSRESSNL